MAKPKSKDRVLPPVNSGPWKRVVTVTANPAAYAAGNTLYSATNLSPVSPGFPSHWARRPDITRVGTLQLGSGGNRTGQCIYLHTRPSGSTDNFIFCGGKMYSYDGTTTATDITPGAVTIDTSARIYCATFGGLLIVSDGVNKPWTYDPATTTAAYIPIDAAVSAWTAYGPPVVYGAKLFFILAAKGGTTYRNTITWSEEALPATGYYQTGYTNFWTLGQTDSDPLFALAATNAELFYFRATSIGAIAGTVNTTFSTTATHDSVSTTTGSVSPASVINVDEEVWFVDETLRQWRITGGELDDMGVRALPEQTTALSTSVAGLIQSVFLPGYRFVLSDNNGGRQRAVFSVANGDHYGNWIYPVANIRAMGILSSAGASIMYMIGTSDDAGALGVEGYVYRFRTPTEVYSTVDDGLGGVTFINRSSVSIPVGSDIEYAQSFHMVTADVYNGAEASVTYTCAIYTSMDTAAGASATSTSPASATAAYNPARAAWGTNARGRDAMVVVSCGDDQAPLIQYGRVIVHRSILGFSPNGP